MNRHVADPGWHWLIIGYFFLGGIAAGAYAMASLAALIGDEQDRRATRGAYYLALPLVAVCGLLLIADLGRPERFLHMLIQSNTWRPMFKWWSPMSAGSWGLSAFGGFSFVSFLAVLAEDNRVGLGRWSRFSHWLQRGWFGRAFQLGGSLAGFFLGAYTGALLSATNQPIWANSTWFAALFVVSAASTGIAATVLVAPCLGESRESAPVHRMERLDRFAIVLELLMISLVITSLSPWAVKTFRTWPGMLVPGFVVPFGLVLPWLLSGTSKPRLTRLAPVLVLLGGFVLRAAIVGTPHAWVLASR